jgi:hypothetical protein
MRALGLLLVVSVSAPAWAQDIDATKLGVSLERIQKGLRDSESTDPQSASLPRLKFLVQVYGQAPSVDLFEGVDLLHGDAPGSAPTHQQILDFLTPQTHRGQAGSISALVEWAVVRIVNWRKKAKCEAEIADYRALLMQGRDIPAPRCTQ